MFDEELLDLARNVLTRARERNIHLATAESCTGGLVMGARVHVSPRIITVACFFCQHSPILGQAASSQTVWRLRSRIILRVS